MRNISAASLAKLATKTGTEPLTVVEIALSPYAPSKFYCDKIVPGICEGRILIVAGIEDGVNYGKGGTSQSVTITLDDHDGYFLGLMGTTDLHRRPVWIYQWFAGIPFSDKFLLFDGYISSPIVYKESDRTFAFTVLSKIDDVEVGFSPEDGFFGYVPDAIIGKTWPIVFGSVAKLPLICIDDIPHGGTKAGGAADSVTKDSVGVRDPSIQKQLFELAETIRQQRALMLDYFAAALLADNTAQQNGETEANLVRDPITGGNLGVGTGTFTQLAKQFQDAGNAALKSLNAAQKKSTELNITLAAHRATEKQSIGVTNGRNFVQGRKTTLTLNGAVHTGVFVGDNFNIISSVHPNDILTNGMVQPPYEDRTGDPVFVRDKLSFADAGQPLMLANFPDNPEGVDAPLRYIVSSGTLVNVTAIFAYRTVNSYKSLYPVPNNYWAQINLPYGTLPVTQINLPQPLSSYLNADGTNAGWEDTIYADCTSQIGPNIIDIMEWLISTYSFNIIDTTSFNTVRNYVAAYPANFAVTDRPTLIKLLNDIAYQSRCVLWLKNQRFYIKYLAVPDPSVATIEESDIIHQTLEVTATETEDLITKSTGEWQPDYLQSNKWKVIQRYHIANYGVHSASYNYTIYNQLQLVEKSVSFWLIRTANTFKKVICQVPITKLNIETMDTVTLNFAHPWISSGPVDCVVEAANVDTGNYTVSLTLWVPIRLGELESFVLAYPGIISEQDIVPIVNDYQSQNPPPSGLNNKVALPPAAKPMSGDTGNGGQFHISQDPYSIGSLTHYTDNGNVAPDFQDRLGLTGVGIISGASKLPTTAKKYQYDKEKVDTTVPQKPTNKSVPGKIDTDNGDNTYNVNIYWEGLDGKPTLVKNVRQIQGDKDNPIPKDTGVIVTQIVYLDSEDKTKVELYIQAPVWL